MSTINKLELRVGAVVRLKSNYLVIITDIREDRVSWVSFGHSNTSGVTRMSGYNRDETCYDCRDVEPKEDCCLCGGKVGYVEWVDGMEDAMVEAYSVKDWIMERLLSGFKF